MPGSQAYKESSTQSSRGTEKQADCYTLGQSHTEVCESAGRQQEERGGEGKVSGKVWVAWAPPRNLGGMSLFLAQSGQRWERQGV